MGITLSYLAVKGKPKGEIWRDLCLSKSPNQNANFHMLSRNQIVGAPAENGWYLIQDAGGKLIEDKGKMTKLSTNAEVLIGEASESTMHTMAAGWSNGSMTWEVSHDRSKGYDNLQVAGSPPEPFAEIKNGYTEKMNALPEGKGPDYYFSIPVDLFMSFTGFSYDGGGDLEISPTDIEFLTS